MRNPKSGYDFNNNECNKIETSNTWKEQPRTQENYTE